MSCAFGYWLHELNIQTFHGPDLKLNIFYYGQTRSN